MFLESRKQPDVSRCQIQVVGWVWNNFKSDTVLEGSDDGVWHLNSKDFLATFALYMFEYDIAFWGQIQSLSSSLPLPIKCHYIVIIWPLINPD